MPVEQWQRDSMTAIEVKGFAFMRENPWQEGQWLIYALIGGTFLVYTSAETRKDAERLTRKTSNRLRRAFERRVRETNG